MNRAFPSNSGGKESACNAGDPALYLGQEVAPTPVFLPGESHGQRSLVSFGPLARKQLDTTERLTHTHTRANNVQYLFACRVDQEGE